MRRGKMCGYRKKPRWVDLQVDGEDGKIHPIALA